MSNDNTESADHQAHSSDSTTDSESSAQRDTALRNGDTSTDTTWPLNGFDIDRRDVLKLLGGLPLASGMLAEVPAIASAEIPEQQKLTPNSPSPNSRFGEAVALSGPGDLALISAPSINATYVFQQDGSAWIQDEKLTPGDNVDDAIGASVAISGNRFLLGAPLDDEKNATGAAYLIDRAQTVTQKLFANDAHAEAFGHKIDIDGNIAIVTDPNDSEYEFTGGAAYVFETGGIVWNQSQKLTATTPAEQDRFGASVAVSGTTALVGAPGDSAEGDGAGAVYVFDQRSDGFWALERKLTVSDSPVDYKSFGTSIALAADGETAIIGAAGDNGRGTNAGAAYVFEQQQIDQWFERQKLTASDASSLAHFGVDVALLDNLILIGAYGSSQSGLAANEGAAYLFERNGNSWAEAEKLTGSDTDADDRFGNSVALGGTTGLVGAREADADDTFSAGAAYSYDVGSPMPILQLGEIRPVQVVENTVLITPSGSTQVDARSEYVDGRNTAVLFDLSVENFGMLPSSETIEFTVTYTAHSGNTGSETFELTPNQVEQLAQPSTNPWQFFDTLSTADLPVFGAGESIAEIGVEVDPDVTGDHSPDLSGGSKLVARENIYGVSMDGLTIGFIEIADPDTGDNYGSGNNGRIQGNFSNLVSEMEDYLRAVFPIAEIDTYEVDDVLNEATTLDTTPNVFVGGGTQGDLQDAHDAIVSEFPDVDFDVTVAVFPSGYDNFHDDGWGGINYYNSEAAIAVIGDLSTGPGWQRLHQVVAQEAAHHFLGTTYPDNLAMRDNNGNIDNSHARTQPDSGNNSPDPSFIVSRGYDLTDGSYDVVGRRMESYMGYNTLDYPMWADTEVYADLIDSGLDTPLDDREGSSTMIGGIGRLESDDTATFTNVSKKEGYPKAAVSGGAVTVTVRDLDGGVLDARTFPDHTELHRFTDSVDESHEVIDDRFTFRVPFPEEAAVIEMERNETVTQLNPIEYSVRAAIERLPEDAFKREPYDRRDSLYDKLDSVAEMMEKGKYHPAKRKMQKDIRDKLKKWLRDEYETGLLQPTKQELLDLVDEMIARLERLARENRGVHGPP